MTYLLPFINTKAKIAKEFHFSKYARINSKKEQFFQIIENKYDFLVVLSEEEKQFYNTKKAVVIPNPIEISTDITLADIKNKAKIAAAILRFAPVKQLDKMVAAWEIFHQTNKEWKLFIYGDTQEAYYNEIKKLVEEKNLSSTIIFKGKTNNVYKALEEVSYLLMTSANECFPMVILEANSCGVPVISFDSPTGPRNIISHTIDGILVPLNDSKAFAEQLTILTANDEKRIAMSLKAVENSKKYQLDKIMDIWRTKIIEK
jgi:glycosyltransferase involved in cell wall biosynthesis